jgi:hypothetical protein
MGANTSISESSLFSFVVQGLILNSLSRMWKDKDAVTNAFDKGAKVRMAML